MLNSTVHLRLTHIHSDIHTHTHLISYFNCNEMTSTLKLQEFIFHHFKALKWKPWLLIGAILIFLEGKRINDTPRVTRQAAVEIY